MQLAPLPRFRTQGTANLSPPGSSGCARIATACGSAHGPLPATCALPVAVMPALSSEAQSPSPPATVTPVSSMSGAGATSQQSFMPAQPRRFLNRSSCATLSPTASLLAGAGLLASSPGSPSAASSAAYAHKLALKDVMPVSLAAPLVSQSNLAPSWTSPQPSPPGQQQAPGPRPLLHAPALLLRSLSSRLRMQVHPSPSPSPSHSQAAQQARAGELGAQRGSAPGVSPTTALDRSVRESTPPDCPLPRGMVGSEPVPPSGSAASMPRRLTARTLSLPRLLPERLVRRQRTMPDETETSDEGRAVHTPGSGTGRAMLLSSGLQGGATDPGPSSGRSLRHAVSLKALLHLDSYEFFPGGPPLPGLACMGEAVTSLGVGFLSPCQGLQPWAQTANTLGAHTTCVTCADVAVAASTDGEDRGSPAPGSPLASTGGCTARRDTCEYSGPLSMGTMSGNGCSSGNASVLPRFPSRQRSSMLEPTRSSSPPPLPHQAQEEAAVLPAGAVLLAVASTLPPAMRRPAWSQRDFTFTKHLHTGYASEVYMVGGCSPRTAGQAWERCAVSVSRWQREGVNQPLQATSGAHIPLRRSLSVQEVVPLSCSFAPTLLCLSPSCHPLTNTPACRPAAR